MKIAYFITHPNVEIDPDVPVPMSPLSKQGFARMHAFLEQPFLRRVTSVYCSKEQKAIDGAKVISDHLSINFNQKEELGENDRSSTGYLPSDEFESIANCFFASPDESVRGWETATAAQQRISDVVDQILEEDETQGDISIVSHGGVGSLLLCRLMDYPIDRKHDQPGGSGGNFFSFDSKTKEIIHSWKPIEPNADTHNQYTTNRI
jgi:broad specificity phosphatase PhoE